MSMRAEIGALGGRHYDCHWEKIVMSLLVVPFIETQLAMHLDKDPTVDADYVLYDTGGVCA